MSPQLVSLALSCLAMTYPVRSSSKQCQPRSRPTSLGVSDRKSHTRHGLEFHAAQTLFQVREDAPRPNFGHFQSNLAGRNSKGHTPTISVGPDHRRQSAPLSPRVPLLRSEWERLDSKMSLGQADDFLAVQAHLQYKARYLAHASTECAFVLSFFPSPLQATDVGLLRRSDNTNPVSSRVLATMASRQSKRAQFPHKTETTVGCGFLVKFVKSPAEASDLTSSTSSQVMLT